MATPAITAIYAGTTGQLTVNWTLDSEADNYTLMCVPAAGATVTQTYTAAAAGAVFNDGTSAQVIITGLTDGVRYLVTLSSENAAGTATATSTPVAYSAASPGAITGLTASPGPAGSGYVDFTWTAPASSGTYPIDHYDTETDYKSAIESSTTSQRVTGLTAGSTHNDECFAVSYLPSDATFSRTLNGPTTSVNYTAPSAAATPAFEDDLTTSGDLSNDGNGWVDFNTPVVVVAGTPSILQNSYSTSITAKDLGNVNQEIHIGINALPTGTDPLLVRLRATSVDAGGPVLGIHPDGTLFCNDRANSGVVHTAGGTMIAKVFGNAVTLTYGGETLTATDSSGSTSTLFALRISSGQFSGPVQAYIPTS